MKTKLNRKIYSENGVKAAVEAYGHLGAIAYKKEKGHFVLEFGRVDESLEDSLVDEFNNYALYATIAGKKSW